MGVCDVGGGSTELAVGSPDHRPDGLISIDIGSLRLTSRFLAGDPPSRRAVERAAGRGADHLGDLAGIQVATALATGGSARALRRIIKGPLSGKALDEVADHLAKRSAVKLAAVHGIGDRRATTLLAGAVILAQATRVVGRPFEVARAGLREGLAAEAIAGGWLRERWHSDRRRQVLERLQRVAVEQPGAALAGLGVASRPAPV